MTKFLLHLLILMQFFILERTAFARYYSDAYATEGRLFSSAFGLIVLAGLVILILINREFRRAVTGYVLLFVVGAWAVVAFGKEFGNQNAVILLLLIMGLFVWYSSRKTDKKATDKKPAKIQEPTDSKGLPTTSLSTEICPRNTNRIELEQANNKRSQSNINASSDSRFPTEGKSQDLVRSSKTQLMTFRERLERDKKNLLIKRISLKTGVVASLLILVAIIVYILIF